MFECTDMSGTVRCTAKEPSRCMWNSNLSNSSEHIYAQIYVQTSVSEESRVYRKVLKASNNYFYSQHDSTEYAHRPRYNEKPNNRKESEPKFLLYSGKSNPQKKKTPMVRKHIHRMTQTFRFQKRKTINQKHQTTPRAVTFSLRLPLPPFLFSFDTADPMTT